MRKSGFIPQLGQITMQTVPNTKKAEEPMKFESALAPVTFEELPTNCAPNSSAVNVMKLNESYFKKSSNSYGDMT